MLKAGFLGQQKGCRKQNPREEGHRAADCGRGLKAARPHKFSKFMVVGP